MPPTSGISDSVDNYFTRQYIPEDNSELITLSCLEIRHDSARNTQFHCARYDS
jgi:hypothetical protein